MTKQKKTNNYLPVSRSREEVVKDINGKTILKSTYDSWNSEQQQLFLDICTGVRGVKITYDPFFKEIFNPEYDTSRLSDLLTTLLGMKVKVLKILPNDTTRIASESTLLITDIVVELADGSIANVEIQKIGYLFLGERASCYSADLLLRQYKRLRDERKKAFSYSDIKPVYTIVFFEESPMPFHAFPKTFLHHVEAKSDTGIELNMLQKYLFVPLDIFRKNMQNKCISSKLEAWLTFLSSDAPDVIETLVHQYPEFKPLYIDIYEMCQNTERIMGLFSKELEILDRNTVQLMIDQQANKIEENEKIIAEQNAVIADKDSIIADKDAALTNMAAELAYYKKLAGVEDSE